jgi:manganese/zinc/iron transport system substrate-binding protein
MTYRLSTVPTVCLSAVSLSFWALAIIGCSGNAKSAPAVTSSSSGESASARYTIVTTCGMVTDIAREVVGDLATVNGLMGEGVDPHLYKPIRSDVIQLTKADIIFYSGLMLEGRMSDLFLRASRDDKPIYAVTEGIDESYLREPPEFEGHFDPHVWMDVGAWSECVAFVAGALGEFDPPNAATYNENAERYRQQLAELDDYIRQSIASIPADRRALITAHDAFGYFGRAYDIEVRSVQGLSTESAAAVDDINRLVDFIVTRKIPAIFVESSVSKKNIEAIIEGTEHKGMKVVIGGKLYSDAMGAPGTYEGTYLGMMDHNATVIARALGGNAPKTGWQSKLKP